MGPQDNRSKKTGTVTDYYVPAKTSSKFTKEMIKRLTEYLATTDGRQRNNLFNGWDKSGSTVFLYPATISFKIEAK